MNGKVRSRSRSRSHSGSSSGSGLEAQGLIDHGAESRSSGDSRIQRLTLFGAGALFATVLVVALLGRDDTLRQSTVGQRTVESFSDASSHVNTPLGASSSGNMQHSNPGGGVDSSMYGSAGNSNSNLHSGSNFGGKLDSGSNAAGNPCEGEEGSIGKSGKSKRKKKKNNLKSKKTEPPRMHLSFEEKQAAEQKLMAAAIGDTGASSQRIGDPGKVPFYLYPPEQFSGFQDCMKTGMRKETNMKFDTDVELILTFARHPWRVYNFSQAKVAIIPIPFNRLARGGCSEAYQKHIRNMKTVIGKQLYSKTVRHVAIANDWKTKYIRDALRSIKPLLVAVKLHRAHRKCTFGIGFSTIYANWRLFHPQSYLYDMPKPHPQRKYFVSFLGQVDGRPGYADRYALFKQQLDQPLNDAYIMTFSTKLGLRPCPTDPEIPVDRCYMHRLERHWAQLVTGDSNFSLALRGDDEGSDRFQNAMIANTMLVAVIEKFDRDVGWLPFPDFIPWKDIVITVPRKQFQADPVGEINKLRLIPQADIDRRRALMKKYTPAIDVEYAGGVVYASHILKQAMITPC